MADVRVRFDTKEVKEALQALRKEGPKAVADALNRTAFEILDAEAIEVRGAFPFASPSSARFLSRGFLFDKATPENLAITVRAKGTRATPFDRPAAPAFLAEHAFGDTIDPDKNRLTFAGKLAVPINVKRSARGKVKASETPGAILERGGFATARAIFQRTGGRRVRGTQQSGRLKGLRLMYLLLERPVKLAARLDFFGVVDRTARTQLPKKAERVLEKLNLRRSR